MLCKPLQLPRIYGKAFFVPIYTVGVGEIYTDILKVVDKTNSK